MVDDQEREGSSSMIFRRTHLEKPLLPVRRAEHRLCRLVFLIGALAGSAGCVGSVDRHEAVLPNTSATLDANEGLLIVQIDTDVPVERVLLTSGAVATALPKGQHLWVIRLPAGRYGWHRVDLGDQSGIDSNFFMRDIDLIRENEFEFEVLSGAINYPGGLIIRTNARYRSSEAVLIRNRNHSAMAVRRLIEAYESLLDAYPIRYAGWSGDGFLEFYSQERRAVLGGDETEER
jgi:hypothetical protein